MAMIPIHNFHFYSIGPGTLHGKIDNASTGHIIALLKTFLFVGIARI
jgi:hypothetical protein